MKRRFNKDKNLLIIDLIDEILVKCPKCERCVKVTIAPNAKGLYFDKISKSRRITCSHCGYFKEIHPKNRWDNTIRFENLHSDMNNITDWYFNLPLYLQIPCCGRMLWSYNLEHLLYIEAYVKSELREGGSYYLSIISRLPKWIKLSKNKNEILKCIERLKKSLNNQNRK